MSTRHKGSTYSIVEKNGVHELTYIQQNGSEDFADEEVSQLIIFNDEEEDAEYLEDNDETLTDGQFIEVEAEDTGVRPIKFEIIENDHNENMEYEEENLILDNSFIKQESNSYHSASEETEQVDEQEEYEEVQTLETNEDDGTLYGCSSCGYQFTSIVQHIEEHHAGQEVIVELDKDENNVEGLQDITENNEQDEDVTEDCQELIEGQNFQMIETYEDANGVEQVDMKAYATNNSNWKMPQILNTLKEEDCVDKDGRLYTRKIVQIEKFWDDESEMQVTKQARVPVLGQYIATEDGSLIPQEPDNAMDIKIEPGAALTDLYHCSNCLKQFESLKEFKVHTCQKDGQMYKCHFCDSVYANPKSLCAHMKVHKGIRAAQVEPNAGPFICTLCDTTFPSNKSLRLHSRMHGPVKVKKIEQFYGSNGPEAVDPSDPADGEPVEPREQFTCLVCNKSYDKAFETIHMAVHNGEQEYNCQICNRKFFTKSNLSMHMRVHTTEKVSYQNAKPKTQKSDLPYNCGFCGRQFARPHEKVKHERIHTGEKPHACEICGKRFRVSYCLTLHMRTHTGARPYVCQKCGKRFKAHSVYNHHLMTHSDVRAYKCPYCPKAFKTAVQLAGHKNSHTKPFSCTECNRPFASLYAVRAHMEIHKRLNSLKYKCIICGASYARGFALKDHMKEQHDLSEGADGTLEHTVTEEIAEDDLVTHILPDQDVVEVSQISMDDLEYTVDVGMDMDEKVDPDMELVCATNNLVVNYVVN